MSVSEEEAQVFEIERAKLIMDFVKHVWGEEKASWLLPSEEETQA